MKRIGVRQKDEKPKETPVMKERARDGARVRKTGAEEEKEREREGERKEERETERPRETERETDKQADRQTESERGRQTEVGVEGEGK